MSKGRFTLKTKEATLFKPVEVEIDGKVYYTKKFTPKTYNALLDNEEPALEGKLDALLAQLKAVIDIPLAILNQLDIRELQAMIDYIQGQFLGADEEDVTEKKDSGDGDKPSLSSPESSPASEATKTS